ncbi:hypothetical protein D3C75_1085800 [compost metagenome]
MGQGAHVGGVGLGGDQFAQLWTARVLVLHVFDEVRQLIAGVNTFEVLATVDVIGAVDQPVNVKHHGSIGTQLASPTTDLLVAGNRRFAAAVMLAREFRQIHRGNVADFCSQNDFAHVMLLKLLLCVSI